MKLTPLPASAAHIAKSFFGPASQVYVTEATWQRLGNNAAAPDDASSEDLARYAVFAAGGHIGYARVRTRSLLNVFVPVAFGTGNFDLRVTVLWQLPAGTRVLISLPGEARLQGWVQEMMSSRN